MIPHGIQRATNTCSRMESTKKLKDVVPRIIRQDMVYIDEGKDSRMNKNTLDNKAPVRKAK